MPRASWSEHPAGERVVFCSLHFTSAEFLIEDAQVTFARCSLVDCRLRSTPTSRLVDFVIERSVWRGVTATPKPHFRFQFTSELEVDAQEVRCRNARSEFYNTWVNLTASRQLSVRVGEARFSNAPPHLSVLGGLQLTVREGEARSDVTISDSVFERQANDDPICAILQMYRGAVTVSVLEPAPDSVLSNVHVSLDRVLFSHNARELSLSGPLHAVRVSGCRFAHNAVINDGAALYIDTASDCHQLHVGAQCGRVGAGHACHPRRRYVPRRRGPHQDHFALLQRSAVSARQGRRREGDAGPAARRRLPVREHHRAPPRRLALRRP